MFMRAYPVFLSLLFCTLLPCLSNNDSTKFDFLKSFNFRLTGGHLYIDGCSYQKYKEPSFLHNQKPSNGIFDDFNDYTGDNPLAHGATWVEFDANFKAYGFTINSWLVAEHRGISYGTFPTKDMIVYPKIKLSFDSSLTILNQKIYGGVHIGYYEDRRMYEGLNIYNIDMVGSTFYLKWKNFKVAYNKVGDLIESIGLGIDDVNDYSLSAEEVELPYNLKMDARVGSFVLTGTPRYNDNESNTTVSLGIYNDNFRIYSQAAFRTGTYIDTADYKHRGAVVAGISGKYENLFFKINSLLEYRYYGYLFNQDLTDLHTNVSYRSSDWYGSTIGPNLYPLYFYERPFSQWAVFTEYQNKNVLGLTFRADATLYVYDKFMIKTNLDFNYIRASYEPWFLYPFYNIGVGYEPFPDCYIMWSKTNRGMNLEKHYPTLYLFEKPLDLLSLKFNFNF
jgi:hypothetical protein